MKDSLQPTALCRFRNRPDARCRKLPRCRTCGRVLAFVWGTGLCFECEQRSNAAAAAANPKKRAGAIIAAKSLPPCLRMTLARIAQRSITWLEVPYEAYRMVRPQEQDGTCTVRDVRSAFTSIRNGLE